MVIPPIQSFYQKASPASSAFSQTLLGTPISNHADMSRAPLTETWKPQGNYARVNISELQPGRDKARFMGRIVNICPAKPDHQPRALSSLPSGFHFMVVKDDTGVVAVSSTSLTFSSSSETNLRTSGSHQRKSRLNFSARNPTLSTSTSGTWSQYGPALWPNTQRQPLSKSLSCR